MNPFRAALDTWQDDWMNDALCAQVGGDLWFPDDGGPTREAKEICRRCPVRQACLDLAIRNGDRDGIWGGLSVRERRPLRRQYLDELEGVAS